MNTLIMNVKNKFILIFLFITSFNLVSLSQTIDTNKTIQAIIKQYKVIVNCEINNIKIDTLENIKAYSDMTSLNERYLIYHNNSDTFLIKVFIIENEENGDFEFTYQEILFQDNTPILFYSKYFQSWNNLLNERTFYLNKSNVFMHLTKETEIKGDKTKIESVFLENLHTDPNIKEKITQHDTYHTHMAIFRFKKRIKL